MATARPKRSVGWGVGDLMNWGADPSAALSYAYAAPANGAVRSHGWPSAEVPSAPTPTTNVASPSARLTLPLGKPGLNPIGWMSGGMRPSKGATLKATTRWGCADGAPRS